MISAHPSKDAIHSLFRDLLLAWTRGDAEAYGRCFTDDADYISFDGTHTHGRAAIVCTHDWLFHGVLAGSALVGEVENVHFLGPDIALVQATGSVLMPWRKRVPKRRLSRQTLLAVNRDRRWVWASFHNTRVRPVHVPEPDALASRAARLVSRALPDQRAARAAAANSS